MGLLVFERRRGQGRGIDVTAFRVNHRHETLTSGSTGEPRDAGVLPSSISPFFLVDSLSSVSLVLVPVSPFVDRSQGPMVPIRSSFSHRLRPGPEPMLTRPLFLFSFFFFRSLARPLIRRRRSKSGPGWLSTVPSHRPPSTPRLVAPSQLSR